MISQSLISKIQQIRETRESAEKLKADAEELLLESFAIEKELLESKEKAKDEDAKLLISLQYVRLIDDRFQIENNIKDCQNLITRAENLLDAERVL
jgi:hypothetical protein